MTERLNMAASVRARLLNRSRATGDDFQFLLQRYAGERFLYRLGMSAHRERFVLKGAMLFPLWGGTMYRATRDLDFTAYGNSALEAVRANVLDICSTPVEDDGLTFDTSAIAIESILEDHEYDGLRARFPASLGQARIHMQIDVGFGDAIHPEAIEVEYPTLLDGSAPRIRAYPNETVVAEKLHAMQRHGEANSRLKDFYDLYVLSSQFPFNGESLTRAIQATFERRRTVIVRGLPAGLGPRFFSDSKRSALWRAYRDRNTLLGAPEDFDAVGQQARSFLVPVWTALAGETAFAGFWTPGKGWEQRR